MLVEQPYWELSSYKQYVVSLFLLLYKNISIAQPEKKNTFLLDELSSIVGNFRGNISPLISILTFIAFTHKSDR